MRRVSVLALPPPVVLAPVVAVMLATVPARADSGFGSPTGGVVQVGRGGAWVARADDPSAVYYNPAGMVRQPNGWHEGVQLLFRSQCFDRRDENGNPVSPVDSALPPPEEMCADIPPFPNPMLAASFRLHQRVAIGLALAAPHGNAVAHWPATISYPNRFGVPQDHPSPSRYLIVDSQGLLLFPTLSLSVAILEELSIGAGFVWGVASVEFAAMAEATSHVAVPDDFRTDVRAQINGTDAFVPGFVVGALGSPHERVDIGAWFTWMDSVRMAVDLRTEANYYDDTGAVNEAAIADPANITEVHAAGRFKLPLPMEARIGARYHHPREGAAPPRALYNKYGGWARDAMSQDLFDVEVDLTWAHNSVVDTVEVRMGPNIPINGTPGFVPENGDVPHNWKDVLGVRLGGEFVALPDLLAVRAGGFFESKGVEDAYLNLDFHEGMRGGIGLGGTVRVGIQEFVVDISLAYQHTFFGAVDNAGLGRVRGLSGDQTAGTATPEDPSDDFRSAQAKNGGRATASLDEVGASATFRF